MEYTYKTLTKKYREEWIALCRKLWPEYKRSEFVKLYDDIAKSPRQTAFLCLFAGKPIAFANISLRVDYVEGSSSSPVGYLEGIYVEKKHRNKGIANKLVKEAEIWAKKKGAKEMGSDTELHNKFSQKFHKAIGFRKAETIVCFVKKI